MSAKQTKAPQGGEVPAEKPEGAQEAPATGGLTTEQIERRWSEAGDAARAAQARGEDGDAVFRAALASAPAVPLPPGTRPASSVPEQRPAVNVPRGAALFENTSEHTVRFTMRDPGNRPTEFTCPAGETVLVPVQYADVVPHHAPQLRRVASSEK